jgi:hypothetical protein
MTRSGWMIGLLIPLATVFSGAAHAECPKAYTSNELSADLGALSTALRAKDSGALKDSGARLDVGLPCLKSPVPAGVFATAYRYLGLYHYRFGEKARAEAWFRSGLELDPTFAWDVAEIEMGDPVQSSFEGARGDATVEPVEIEGKELNLPAGSSLVLDGRKLTKPIVTPGRPHLLQVVADSDRSVRQVMLIEGNALPERFLKDIIVADASTGKKKKRGKTDTHTPNEDLSVVKVKRVRPAAKTPLMLTGAIVALGAGGVYGASFATRASFDSAKTTSDLEKYQSLTNTLVIASGATLVLGLGVEYAGIMLSPTPGGAAFGWTRGF